MQYNGHYNNEQIPYNGKPSKVQNFSVNIKYLTEEILEELNFKAPSYITAHIVACKLICHLHLIFEELMVTLNISKLKSIQKFPTIQCNDITSKNVVIAS